MSSKTDSRAVVVYRPKGKGKGKQEMKPKNRKRKAKPASGTSVVLGPANAKPVKAKGMRIVNSSAMAWAYMMVNPKDAPTVLSPVPADSPVTVSVARFNFVREITYANTVAGAFAVIATPAVKDPLIIQSLNPRYPSAGDTPLSGATMGLVYAGVPGDTGVPSAGYLIVSDNLTGQKVVAQTLQTQVGHKSWAIVLPAGNVIRVGAVNKGNAVRNVRPFYLVNGAWVAGTTLNLMGGQGLNASDYTVPAGNTLTAFTLILTDANGTATDPDKGWGAVGDIEMSALFNSGHVDPASGPGTVGEFVSDELAEQGQLQNVRVTAMSMLVSPIGQWANIGGEIVMARTLTSNIVGSANVNELMQNLQQLNEDGRPWINVPTKDGCYGWWLPDDSSSYAPHPYAQAADGAENVLVCAGVMSAGNSVRIVATYVVEFYSPKQVFVKKSTPSLDGPYLEAMRLLKRMPAVSTNEDHDSLISRIKMSVRNMLAQVPRAISFANDHKSEILAAAELASLALT